MALHWSQLAGAYWVTLVVETPAESPACPVCGTSIMPHDHQL